jgi:YidC/Oxa1 family membrane protein insertase
MATPQRGFGAGGPNETRNLVLAIVLSMLVFLVYEFTFGQQSRQQAAQQQTAAAQAEKAAPAETRKIVSRAAALRESPRVRFENNEVDGSIALIGARFDDLSLKRYRETVKEDSPEVTLLTPQDAEGWYDSYFGWEDPYTGDDLVGARTPWTAPPGARLTPQTPLVLTYHSPDGLTFTRTISMDEQSMFTITDKVENASGAARTIRPVSVVRRLGLPKDFAPVNAVQGFAGVFGPGLDYHDANYRDGEKLAKDKANGKKPMDATLTTQEGTGGWLGISDHYWITALIPAQTDDVKAEFNASPRFNAVDFRADYTGKARAVAPGASIEYAQRLFSGAKRADMLQTYQKELGIPQFDRAIDWGHWFWFLTRPMFALLDFLGRFAGNFGVGILLTTIVVKLVLFPLVNASFESMSKMRKVQPKMKEIQEKFASDRERQQQEMMKLYQQEKINPVLGCLPIFAQIPVFFALYKTLSVTIEMRHAEFFGWIKDLSARDPTNLFNLFGLLPFDPTQIPFIGGFLWLGLLPILYGLSMFATQSLSPQATDPTQQMIFRWMPVVLTFFMAGVVSGLLVYWIWSNILSFVQQYIIMRKNGVETELDKLIAKYFAKAAPS